MAGRTASTTPCPDDGALAAFVARELEESARADVEAHCEACERCHAAVTVLVQAFAESAPGVEVQFHGLPEPGTTLERYLIVEPIGAGAMGAVFAAYDPELDRRVALKVLLPGANPDAPMVRARFVAEARAVAAISHPNVIAVHDVGAEGSRAFFAMELVAGSTLRAWLDNETRPLAAIIEVFAAAGRGLAAAHGGGLVHRDFKPDNVLVGDDGRVRVIDFGLARATLVTDTDDEPADLQSREMATRTGAIVGTPAYMAPEQLRSKPADARSDQFAFCVALYEAVVGRRPFQRESLVARLTAIEDGEIRWEAVPRRLRRVLERGLAAKPEERWASMSALVHELRPRPLSRWALPAAIVVGGVGTAFGVHGAVSGETGPSCLPSEQRLHGVWDDARRSAFVLATTTESGVALGEPLAAAFDRYAQRWVEHHAEACAATVERREHSTRVLDRRMHCLDRARSQLEATVAAGIEAGAEGAVRSAEFLATLPQLDICMDPRSLENGPAMPEGRAQLEGVATAQKELAEVRAQAAIGHVRPAAERADRVAERARELDYPPLEVEALLEAGMRYSLAGEAELSAARLTGALRKGIATGSWDAAASAAARRAREVVREQPEVAAAHVETALGLAQRPGVRASTRALVAKAHANLLLSRGDVDRADREQLRAIELVADQPGLRPHEAIARREYGDSLAQRGRLDEAETELREAIRLLELDFSPDGREVLTTKAMLANNVLVLRGEYADAEVIFRAVFDAYLRTVGPKSPNAVASGGMLAVALQYQDKFDEAEVIYRETLEMLLLRVAPDHPMVLATHAAIAGVQMDRGLPEVAIASYRRVLPEMIDALGPTSLDVGIAAGSLARAEKAVGRPDDALATLEPVLAACTKPDAIPRGLCGELVMIRGEIFAAQGDVESAGQWYDRAETWLTETGMLDARRVATLAEIRGKLATPARE